MPSFLEFFNPYISIMTTKAELPFNKWFDIVNSAVQEDTGDRFTDRAWAHKQYDYGRDAFDVADEVLEMLEP